MQHGSKSDLLIKKRNLPDLGRIISLPVVKKRGISIVDGQVSLVHLLQLPTPG